MTGLRKEAKLNYIHSAQALLHSKAQLGKVLQDGSLLFRVGQVWREHHRHTMKHAGNNHPEIVHCTGLSIYINLDIHRGQAIHHSKAQLGMVLCKLIPDGSLLFGVGQECREHHHQNEEACRWKSPNWCQKQKRQSFLFFYHRMRLALFLLHLPFTMHFEKLDSNKAEKQFSLIKNSTIDQITISATNELWTPCRNYHVRKNPVWMHSVPLWVPKCLSPFFAAFYSAQNCSAYFKPKIELLKSNTVLIFVSQS